MNSHIILCSGGARSGKSEFAESLALSQNGRKGYIATGQAFDEEMKDRISKHKARRGTLWNNYEIPLHITKYWDTVSADCDIILIDCLTMYTSNYIFDYGSLENQAACNEVESIIMKEVDALLAQIRKDGKTAIFVTNELGLGVVPENKLARYFRDIAGRVNRQVATAADQMYFTISGITIELKAQEATVHG